MFAVDPRRYRPVSFPEFQVAEARRAAMMRLTTDREDIAQAEADAAVMLARVDAALARTVVVGRWVGPHFVPEPKPSAKIARERLRCIVLQDRETCPAWRWVPVERAAPPVHLVACVAQWALRGVRGDHWCGLIARSFARSWRRRYRWERRA